MSAPWSDAMVVGCVLAPVAALVPAFSLPAGAQRWGRGGCAVAAAGWAVLLVSGQHPTAGWLAPDGVALAAAVGAALLGARAAGAPAAVTTVVTAALAAGHAGRPSVIAPLVGIALAAVVCSIAGHTNPSAAAATAVLTALAATGVDRGGHAWLAIAAGALALGAAIVAYAPRSSLSVAAPAVLVELLRIGHGLEGTTSARVVAVVLAGAVALAASPPLVARRLPAVPPVVLVLPWVAIAAVGPWPGTAAAAPALGAGAVLALALGGPVALAALLPGAVVLVDAMAGAHGGARAVLAALAMLTVFAACRPRAPASMARSVVEPLDAVSGALAVWLVLRPTSWAWLHLPAARSYTEGVAIMAAVALVGGVALAATGSPYPTGTVVRGVLGAPAPPAIAPWTVRRAGAIAAAAMLAITVALVRSAGL